MCIPTPGGCNLARREIVHDITTSPLTNEKEGCCYIPCLFYIFLASVFHGHFLMCCTLAVLYFSGVRRCLYL